MTFREDIWNTTLGIRAKLTLLALHDASEVHGNTLHSPPDIFLRVTPMLGRKLRSIVHSIKRLEGQKIVSVSPNETGYLIEFHPENEVRNAGHGKQQQQKAVA